MSKGYEALRSGAAWIDLSARGRVVLTGRDRARLMHNISSNEIKKLPAGRGCYAFLLNPQGRIQADLLLFALADRFLITVEPESREKLLPYMRRYIVADQVELEDVSAERCEIAVEGPAAAGLLAAMGAPAPEAEYAHTAWEDALVARVSATGEPGFRLFAPAASKTAFTARLEAAGAVAASAEDARVVRVENGIPRFGEDIDDTSLPQETQQMQALNFTKGCYLGQEIVERIRARGQVHRKLQRIELPGAGPAEKGSEIETDGKKAVVTTSVYSPKFGKAIALAYVRD